MHGIRQGNLIFSLRFYCLFIILCFPRRESEGGEGSASEVSFGRADYGKGVVLCLHSARESHLFCGSGSFCCFFILFMFYSSQGKGLGGGDRSGLPPGLGNNVCWVDSWVVVFESGETTIKPCDTYVLVSESVDATIRPMQNTPVGQIKDSQNEPLDTPQSISNTEHIGK